MYPLTVGLVIETKELWDEVHSALQDLPVRLLIEQHELGDLVEFLDKVERLRPEVMILEVLKLREPMEHVVGRIKSSSVDPMVIALHNTAEPELILSALRAGAHEFLHPPLKNNLQQALERKSLERNKTRERQKQKGRVVGFLSAKGGCGATTIACHTAAELGRHDKHVLLADMDLDAGMIRFLMKTKSPYSVLDALNNLHRLDQSYWNALNSNGLPGLEIISAPQAGKNDVATGIRHVAQRLPVAVRVVFRRFSAARQQQTRQRTEPHGHESGGHSRREGREEEILAFQLRDQTHAH